MTAEEISPEDRIDRYLLGQATEEDLEILNELLAGDEQLRKQYRFRIALEGGYREAAIRGDSLDLTVGLAITETETQSSSRKSFLYGAAVAAASLAAVALFVLMRWAPDDRGTSPAVASAVTGVPVARLVTSLDASWRDIDPSPGAFLEKGRFRLDSGIVELVFNRGARVTLRGPSSFELKNTDVLQISSGNLVARIPEEAIGFTIVTDEAEVVDLGTEFGLRVGNGRQTEVHVIEGLVEVFPREDLSSQARESIRIEEGQAIRWKAGDVEEMATERIPVRSRRGVLGARQRSDLGLTFLQGNIRLKETVSSADLRRSASSWIEVIPEQSGVMLDQDIPVTLVSPGKYRVFGDSGQVIPAGTKVDSYLFHFRSAEPSPVQGVIKFDQEIVGLVCEAGQLAITDSIVGREGMRYPVASRQYRGLEPHVRFKNPNANKGGGWTADEVTVSQDRKTVGLSVNVNPRQGVDQLRVLVRSKGGS
ncbi:MAG: FecR domain-containing protein [Planctomycetota bacterium]